MASYPLIEAPRVSVASWPAAALAGRLLADLGAKVDTGPAVPGVGIGSVLVETGATSIEQDWAATGLAPIMDRPDGPLPTHAGAPATYARACSLVLQALSEGGPGTVRTDGRALLGQRARISGLVGEGEDSAGRAISLGGSARLLPASDGWFALSLPRPEDLSLVGPLVELAQDGAVDHWTTVAQWAAKTPVGEIESRAGMLGLAVGVLPSFTQPTRPWTIRQLASPKTTHHSPSLVVNLGSLWAAPLCGQLLRMAGYDIVDVESPHRPDGTREGSPAFYQALHWGHDRVTLDVGTESGRRDLIHLLSDARVIITGSRTRALAQLGARPDAVAAPHDQVWIQISGHGAQSDRIAFGDDAAVAGGLVSWGRRGPAFVGDAIADPLTGLTAAVAALACLLSTGSWHVELSMRDISAAAMTWPEQAVS
jgi:hypothetical protein